MQALRRMGEKISMLVHRAALDRHVGPQRRQRLFEAPRTIDDTTSSGVRNPRLTRSSSSARQAASLALSRRDPVAGFRRAR